MEFALPEESRNRLIQLANLMKKGYHKWEGMSPKIRNTTTGIVFVTGGVVLPKLLFVAAMASFFVGRHMYLNGEVEDAAREIVSVEDESLDESS